MGSRALAGASFREEELSLWREWTFVVLWEFLVIYGACLFFVAFVLFPVVILATILASGVAVMFGAMSKKDWFDLQGAMTEAYSAVTEILVIRIPKAFIHPGKTFLGT